MLKVKVFRGGERAKDEEKLLSPLKPKRLKRLVKTVHGPGLLLGR